MRNASQNTINKYKAIIKKRLFKEQELISFRKLLANYNHQPEVRELLTLFRNKAPHRITKEQSLKGLNWLKKRCFKRDGGVRESKNRPFDFQECMVLKEILNDYSHWTLEDLQEPYYSNMSNYPHYLPVYTIHSKKALTLTYLAGMQGEVYLSSVA